MVLKEPADNVMSVSDSITFDRIGEQKQPGAFNPTTADDEILCPNQQRAPIKRSHVYVSQGSRRFIWNQLRDIRVQEQANIRRVRQRLTVFFGEIRHSGELRVNRGQLTSIVRRGNAVTGWPRLAVV